MNLVALALVACKGPEPSSPEGTTATTTTTTTTTTVDTAGTGDTGTTTTTTPTTTYDCTQPLPTPQFVRYHDYVVSSEDFTFDDEGYLWGVATSHGGLIRTPLDGNTEIMLPNVSSWGRGVRFLPGGDIVIAEPDRGALIRVDRNTMGYNTISGGYNQPNGLAVGLDGFVQLTQATGEIMRIDPDSGTQVELYDNPVTTDGIAFGPDFRQLYWNSEGGEIATLRLDDNGAVEQTATLVDQVNGFLDGMSSDACGNLYVIVMTGRVVRITPDGDQHTVADVSNHFASFISAVNFGSGIGGWERDHIYVMSLFGGVYEIDVGIPGILEPHLR